MTLFGLVSKLRFLVVALLAAVMLSPAQAQDGTLLVVERAETEPVAFDLARLQALPRSGFVTSTVWTEQVDQYEGVMLRDLLQDYGIDVDTWQGRVVLVGLDGYNATLTHDLITTTGPLLAFLRNGSPMPVRSQGPIWALFPYDDNPAYRTESIYAMSVWQLTTLRILE